MDANQQIEGYFGPLAEVSRVELDKTETRVFMHLAQREEFPLMFPNDSYLLADGKRYAAKRCDGLALGEQTFLKNCGKADVVFHFEPLPLKTVKFDFYGGEGSRAVNMLGIENATTKASKLFPSCWRNDATGDWEIAFYDECAIYDCRFWNYKHMAEKDGKFDLVLEADGEEILVAVSKAKHNKRVIKIDAKTVECSLISTITLPDYPAKETRTSFVDTNYEIGDSVTLVGWIRGVPEGMKKFGDEYSVAFNNFFTDEQESSYTKMDSLGRFTMKIPMINSSEVFFDWERTFIRTLFEAGETYFLLYDYQSGHKMFMGKNARLQNEILAYPIAWSNYHAPGDELPSDEYLKGVKAIYDGNMDELNDRISKHPSLSERYKEYLTGNYTVGFGRELMQGQYRVKDRELSDDYMKSVGELWNAVPKPYTRYREFGTFLRDYVGELVGDRYGVTVGKGTIIFHEEAFASILKHFRDAGKIEMTDEDLDILKRGAEIALSYNRKMVQTENEEEQEKLQEELNNNDFFKKAIEIHGRDDVNKLTTKTGPLVSVFQSLAIADSIINDDFLRELIITNDLYHYIDHDRKPLSEEVMEYFDENVKSQSARDIIHQAQEKYLAIEQRDISKLANLKKNDNLEGMSDGEQLLRKILEPYKGKIVLIDFWGTWCGPCKAALAHAGEMREALKDIDIIYLYLANRSPEDAWKNVIKEYDLLGDNIVHYNLPDAQQTAIQNFMNIYQFPTNKLVDKQGNILDINADVFDLKNFEELVRKIASN